jgi:hypothetical protein
MSRAECAHEVRRYLTIAGCATVEELRQHFGASVPASMIRAALKSLGAAGRTIGDWPKTTPNGDRWSRWGTVAYDDRGQGYWRGDLPNFIPSGSFTVYRLTPWARAF